MNILVVASKFPPEYSGPGVRIPRLYENICASIDLENLYIYCNSSEFSDTKSYTYKHCKVRRRVPFFNQKNKGRFGGLFTHLLENIYALRDFKFYENHKIDLVHIIGNSGATASALHWSARLGIPVLMELVNADAQPAQRFLIYKKITPHAPFKIVTISSALKDRCLTYGITDEVIWNRPNPVDIRSFCIDFDAKQSLRGKLTPFVEDDYILLSIAKFIPRKNHLFLLDVLSALPNKYKLILAGPVTKHGAFTDRDSLYVSEIKNKIHTLGLSKRVLLILDFVESPDYMKLSDLYVLPGVNEGLGTPMLEAICCGMPVVANTEPAFMEWIKDGENGYTIDLDVEKWCDAIYNSETFQQEQRRAEALKMRRACGSDYINSVYVSNIKDLIR